MRDSELISAGIFFSKGYTENWSGAISIIDSFFKTNPWTIKLKDLNGEEIIRNFNEIELLLNKS